MNTRLLLALLVTLTTQIHSARAEYRTIAIEITKVGPQNKRTLSINLCSDVGSEKKKGVGLKEATSIIKKAQGWGSGVGVAILVNGADLLEYVALVQAVAENHRLDLVVLGPPGTNTADQMLANFKK